MKKSVAILFLLLAQFNASQASAAIVYSATVIANTLGETLGEGSSTDFSVNRLVDQSGLSAGYTSGVTDFDVATAATNINIRSGQGDSQWRSGNGATTGRIDFDLGDTVNVTSLAWWNAYPSNGLDSQKLRHVDSFTVFTSAVSDFSTSTNVGTFSNPQSVAGTITASKFDLTTVTQAQYVRVQINSNYGLQPRESGGQFTEMGEIAFGGTAVPEPTTFGLLSVFGIGLVTARRRRR